MAQDWLPERRKAAAERARKHQIWKHSTGPRTAEGKAIVSQNAKKHGLRGGILRHADSILIKSSKLLRGLK